MAMSARIHHTMILRRLKCIYCQGLISCAQQGMHAIIMIACMLTLARQHICSLAML